MDYGVALYLVAAIMMLLIPMDKLLMDILLSVDMAIAFAVLFTAMFSKEVLDMSYFPTILLFTTIFRIALNVSSTRLILTTGDPGKVIQVFGQFVGGGNLVIGVIIYIIILIVQLIVINKGSERVAEVTARFTLDAMPGKQMAIDADLNTGAIDDAEAKRRRNKLQEEASFFGSMDGASKYVKGDTAAGLIITVINIVGGLIMGIVAAGMSLQDAMQHYTILTIGDGLVGAIPSLMISMATGILVTKGAHEADFGRELIGQVFGVTKSMYLVGGVLTGLGILTPLPTITYVGLGVVFIIAARVSQQAVEESKIEEMVQEDEVQAEAVRKPENVNTLLQVDPIELEFGYGIIPLADVNQGGDLLDRVVMIRRQIALELGTV
ncbi:MAG: FHIPEP family type III secretion protein, partial [Lachnospiraceae bacterium]|nr:FHIPEP family type III secretion protein [Lachnospiraceae bacterium]